LHLAATSSFDRSSNLTDIVLGSFASVIIVILSLFGRFSALAPYSIAPERLRGPARLSGPWISPSRLCRPCAQEFVLRDLFSSAYRIRYRLRIVNGYFVSLNSLFCNH
jgi:hypothetical protein